MVDHSLLAQLCAQTFGLTECLEHGATQSIEKQCHLLVAFVVAASRLSAPLFGRGARALHNTEGQTPIPQELQWERSSWGGSSSAKCAPSRLDMKAPLLSFDDPCAQVHGDRLTLQQLAQLFSILCLMQQPPCSSTHPIRHAQAYRRLCRQSAENRSVQTSPSCFGERHLVYVMPAVTCSPERADRFRRNQPSGNGSFSRRASATSKSTSLLSWRARSTSARYVAIAIRLSSAQPCINLPIRTGEKEDRDLFALRLFLCWNRSSGVQLATGMDQRDKTTDVRADHVLNGPSVLKDKCGSEFALGGLRYGYRAAHGALCLASPERAAFA